MPEYGMGCLPLDAEASCEFHELILAKITSFITADYLLNIDVLSLLTTDQSSCNDSIFGRAQQHYIYVPSDRASM